VGTPENSPSNFTGTVYVATPQLLATYGIKASQIAPGTDILTMRPGLAGLPDMEMTWSTRSDTPDAGEFAAGATALGIVIAFGVLAASVGLIRSETARDLRTLTATGASTTTRRMITAATAAALGLLGAILGMAGAVIAGLAWAHSSLSATFGDVPLTDVLILLIGLPLIAAAGGWLLAGREPDVISRQPLD
jgi:putative ABC transport system permease protein